MDQQGCLGLKASVSHVCKRAGVNKAFVSLTVCLDCVCVFLCYFSEGIVFLCGHRFSSCLRSVQKLSTFDSDVRIDRLYVHIDFKGSPPKPQYLLECFPLWRQWGATGIIFEWEDMLPFEGKLEVIKKSYCYTKEEVKLMIAAAEKEGLHCIPLVQTFGHLEFVLKHSEFSALRENPKEVLNLCPLTEGSQELAKELINQTLKFHPSADIIHIGCDEVFNLGFCEKCQLKAMEKGLANVFVDHVSTLLEYCKSLNVRPLIWHDMMDSYPSNLLSEKLGNIGEPVLWHYGDVSQVSDSTFDNLYSAFPRVWGATAFKGAAEPDAVWTPLHQRFANHLSWLEKAVLLKERARNLEAIVVTGWSRFSHNSALCEILPVGLPSLHICLRMLQKGHFSSDLIESAAAELGIPEYALLFDETGLDGCAGGGGNATAATADTATSMCEDGNGEGDRDMGTNSKFPGWRLYHFISKLEAARQIYLKIDGQICKQGKNMQGVREQCLEEIQTCISGLEGLREELRAGLNEIFYTADVDEFMVTKFEKVLGLVRELKYALN